MVIEELAKTKAIKHQLELATIESEKEKSQRLLDKVKKIGKNPLEAAHMEEQDAFLQEKIEEENKDK